MAAEYYNLEIIGRLATEDEVPYPHAVIVNRSNEIQYNIKVLSSKSGIPTEIITGYIDRISNLEPHDYEDDEYADENERIEDFLRYYKDRLFIFTYRKVPTGFMCVETAYVVKRPPKVDTNSSFVTVPCFCGKEELSSIPAENSFRWDLFKTYNTYEEFVQTIQDGKPVGRAYKFEVTSENFPEFVVWKDSKQMCAVGPVKAEINPRGMIVLQADPKGLCKMVLDDESDDASEYMVQSPDNLTLIHFAEAKYYDLVNSLSVFPPALKSTRQESGPNSSVIDVCAEVPDVIPSVTSDSPRDLPTEKSEAALFDFFQYHSQKSKLFYNPKDITNFHTAIKTGSLVILSGMSGTGKSALVDAYAKALGIKNVLVIPVRPAWNDDSDLLGYVDLIHMVYRPSDTGFINKIVEASRPENKNKMYLICLDEMNLARVEHYFSQFLSILEKPVGSRELILYDEQYSGQLYNSAKYPQSVLIGDNIKFIGTVNIDESTYHFSDKVLDRANVITLDVLDYSVAETWKAVKYNQASTPEWTNEDFSSLIKKDDVQIEQQERIRGLLWRIHLKLQSVSANLGVGPRIVKSIENYLRNLPETDDEFALSLGEGLDYQIVQRIMTKIRGPEEQLKVIFSTDPQKSDAITSLFDEYEDLSDFSKSRKSIQQKENELRSYGYCL